MYACTYKVMPQSSKWLGCYLIICRPGHGHTAYAKQTATHTKSTDIQTPGTCISMLNLVPLNLSLNGCSFCSYITTRVGTTDFLNALQLGVARPAPAQVAQYHSNSFFLFFFF